MPSERGYCWLLLSFSAQLFHLLLKSTAAFYLPVSKECGEGGQNSRPGKRLLAFPLSPAEVPACTFGSSSVLCSAYVTAASWLLLQAQPWLSRCPHVYLLLEFLNQVGGPLSRTKLLVTSFAIMFSAIVVTPRLSLLLSHFAQPNSPFIVCS